ncbi:hypothetical protein [Terrabacter sp. Ter38]|uniref:hypothetical protein n=1 Tax=Terrabacter sp. Ter38 TaxID=2926030 RepID=UPI0021190893|nr:hypothetical protein [Terrabacter sp. Ter38]
MSAPISPTSANSKVPAVEASNTDPAGGIAVHGYAPHGHGVEGQSDGSKGVVGTSRDFQGVYGHSEKNAGVVGESSTWVGVYGKSMGDKGIAVMGEARDDGAAGVPGNGTGIYGVSTTGIGVSASSATGEAIRAETNSPTVAAISAFSTNEVGTGAALYAKKSGTVGYAGFFEGNVAVTGDVILTGADVAEEFNMLSTTSPGSVVVLDDQAHLDRCVKPYDRRVAGIVSGLGDRKPAVVLDRVAGVAKRQPVAVVGKAWCLADASLSPIAVGDLLTTSSRPGHAMCAMDKSRAFGSVIGKALTPLASGTGRVLVLVGLG